MREIVLDAEKLLERESAQRYLMEAFGFPDFYGRNLDALHDMLGELGEARIIFKNPRALGERYARRVLRVVRDSAEENPGLSVELAE